MENRRKTVVVIDDDMMVLNVLSKYLERFNVKVYTATTVSEGLKLIMDYVPDLVVTDLSVGFLTGMDLFKLMKKHNYSDRFLFITGHDKNELTSNFNIDNELLNQFVFKPFNYSDLTNKMYNRLHSA